MIAVKFIPEDFYYIIGGIAGFLICVFFYWLGQDRDLALRGIWDKIVLLSFIPLGLFPVSTWLTGWMICAVM